MLKKKQLKSTFSDLMNAFFSSKRLGSVILILLYFIKLIRVFEKASVCTLHCSLANFPCCWIFNKRSEYQALISLGSLLRFNRNINFVFYLIIPQTVNIGIEYFKCFEKLNCIIKIRWISTNTTTFKNYSKLTCRWPPIITYKLLLPRILPNMDQILYLDTDLICISSISHLLRVPISNYLAGGVWKSNQLVRWINSGFIYYNLKEIRRNEKTLLKCAEAIQSCTIDDVFHTFCIPQTRMLLLPFRYNIDLNSFKQTSFRTSDWFQEQKSIVFFHLMGDLKNLIYQSHNFSLITKFLNRFNSTQLTIIFHRIFDAIEWANSFTQYPIGQLDRSDHSK